MYSAATHSVAVKGFSKETLNLHYRWLELGAYVIISLDVDKICPTLRSSSHPDLQAIGRRKYVGVISFIDPLDKSYYPLFQHDFLFLQRPCKSRDTFKGNKLYVEPQSQPSNINGYSREHLTCQDATLPWEDCFILATVGASIHAPAVPRTSQPELVHDGGSRAVILAETFVEQDPENFTVDPGFTSPTCPSPVQIDYLRRDEMWSYEDEIEWDSLIFLSDLEKLREFQQINKPLFSLTNTSATSLLKSTVTGFKKMAPHSLTRAQSLPTRRKRLRHRNSPSSRTPSSTTSSLPSTLTHTDKNSDQSKTPSLPESPITFAFRTEIHCGADTQTIIIGAGHF
ncbi:hypothetical protein DL96DRAFT_1705000 [Flagelloscypha sp. PMI_526]|nr:hypothetical protein DL96DRAFT_1705000 [Flagelloscypha sp. PMI_526]